MSKKIERPATWAKTPKFRVSFPALFEPQEFENDGNPKYGVTMLFPKGTNLKALEKAHEAAVKAGIEKKWDGKKPKNLKSPFRDGDEEESYSEKDGYAGHIFIRATSKDKPGVVNQLRENIEDPADLVAGYYARATIVAYPYNVKGNKGVAFGLQNVQLLAEGEAFSGRMKAEDEFEDWEEEEDEDEDEDEDDFE